MKKLNIRVALKHTPNPESGIMDKFVAKSIQLWTDSPYYHAEIIIDDIWISALPEKGVFINKLRDKISDRWLIIPFKGVRVTNEQYEKIDRFIMDRLGDDYDNKGIVLSQIIKVGADDPHKWFCSELTSKILQLCLVDEYMDINPAHISPADIYRLSKHRI